MQHEPVWRDAFSKEVQRDREYNTKVVWSAVWRGDVRYSSASARMPSFTHSGVPSTCRLTHTCTKQMAAWWALSSASTSPSSRSLTSTTLFCSRVIISAACSPSERSLDNPCPHDSRNAGLQTATYFSGSRSSYPTSPRRYRGRLAWGECSSRQAAPCSSRCCCRCMPKLACWLLPSLVQR